MSIETVIGLILLFAIFEVVVGLAPSPQRKFPARGIFLAGILIVAITVLDGRLLLTLLEKIQ